MPELPWRVLTDRARSRALRWEPGPERVLFEGQHHGYAHRPSGAICRRRFIAQFSQPGAPGRWHITDEIIGTGAEPVTWRLHLTPTEVRRISSSETRHVLELPGAPTVRVALNAPPGFGLTVGESPASDSYGVSYPRPCLVLSGVAELPARFDMIFTVV